MAAPLLLNVENKIATITLNRPDQFNSLSLSSEDHKEGIAAYQEGRPPKFENR